LRILTLAQVFLLLPVVTRAQTTCVVPVPLPESTASSAPSFTRSAAETSSIVQISGNSPALRHILESGAKLQGLAFEHGMQTYIASSPGHFMVFDEAPDHRAIVAGTILQVPLQTVLDTAQDRVHELPKAHGLRTFFLRMGDRFQVFYATPDERRLIPGVMWDAQGRNLTREQIASIPGTTPVVEIGPGASQSNHAQQVSDAAALQTISATTSGSYGQAGAPHLWMFVDPQCSYSVRGLQELLPIVQAGKVRLSVIPLSLLDHEDQGLSTVHAIAMLTKPEDQMVQSWMSNDLNNGSTGKAVSRLQANMAAASAVALKGTPTFFWRKQDGSLGRADGMPPDMNAVLASIGS